MSEAIEEVEKLRDTGKILHRVESNTDISQVPRPYSSDALLKEHRCEAVSQVMETHLTESCLLEQPARIRSRRLCGCRSSPFSLQKIPGSYRFRSHRLRACAQASGLERLSQLQGHVHCPSEIAETLDFGVMTISTYQARILEKLSLKNSAELIRYTLQRGHVS